MSTEVDVATRLPQPELQRAAREQSGRAQTDRVWLWFAFGLVFLLMGLLVGPRVPAADQRETCIGNVQLSGPFGIGLNCDSPQFMWLARDPAALFNLNNERQARPGLVIAASLLQWPLALLQPPEGPAQSVAAGIYDPPRIAQSFVRDLPAYLAYVLLNIAILLASFGLLAKIIDRWIAPGDESTDTIVIAAGLLLVANDVTKAFVWSPHTQMFNILVPVLAVYAILRACEGAIFERRFMFCMGLAVGVGFTAYPTFFVITACMVPLGVWMIARHPSPDARRRGVGNLALLVVLTLAPMATWYLCVRAITGSFFQFEVAQGEVVWMAEAWHKGVGVFLSEWFGNLGLLIAYAVPQALPLAVVVIFFAAFFLLTKNGSAARAALRQASPMIIIALYVSFAILGFYTCVGWTVERLAYPAIPPLLAAMAVLAAVAAQKIPRQDRRIFAAGFVLVAVAQVIFVLIKNGPWS